MTKHIWDYYQEYFDKIGKSKENIIHIPGFMTNDEIDLVMNYIGKYRDDPEFSGGKTLTLDRIKDEDKKLFELIMSYGNRVLQLMQKEYCEKYNIRIKHLPWNPFHIVKWKMELKS